MHVFKITIIILLLTSVFLSDSQNAMFQNINEFLDKLGAKEKENLNVSENLVKPKETTPGEFASTLAYSKTCSGLWLWAYSKNWSVFGLLHILYHEVDFGIYYITWSGLWKLAYSKTWTEMTKNLWQINVSCFTIVLVWQKIQEPLTFDLGPNHPSNAYIYKWLGSLDPLVFLFL